MYKLYYWPGLPGRGELVRLVLEEIRQPYVDVARLPVETGGGAQAIMEMLQQTKTVPALAPPILQDGDLVIAQVANICQLLAVRHGLVPAGERARSHALQLQLTIADVVSEAHDTHHPISVMDHYEDQKPEAQKRAAFFTRYRIPKFLGYFERTLGCDSSAYLLGDEVSYPDLSLFQLLEGLRFAFPNAMKRIAADIPLLCAHENRVAERPNIAAYLASDRRLGFNNKGIFRHYPELDPA